LKDSEVQYLQNASNGDPAVPDLPFITVKGERTQPSLTFFSLSTCAMCRRAQAYLEEKGFAYRYLVVDLLPPEDKARLKERLSRSHGVKAAFPALVIDDRRLVLGFFKGSWDEALGALDG
jgi:glutaredoxin